MTNKDMIIIGSVLTSVISTVVAVVSKNRAETANLKAARAIEEAAEAKAKAARTVEDVNTLCKRLDTTFDDIASRTTIEISDELIDSVVSKMAERKVDRVIPGKVNTAVKVIENDITARLRADIDKKVDAVAPEIEEKLRNELEGLSIDDIRKKVIADATTSAKEEALREIEREKNSAISDMASKVRELDRAKDSAISELNNQKRNLINDLEKIETNLEDELEDKAADLADELKDAAEEKFEEELDNLTTRYKSRLDDVSNIYASLANKITK